MKLVHTSDTQIKNWPYGGTNPETNLNRRFEDALACFDFVIDHAIKIKAQYFVHSGDVNEERNPDSVAIELFAERVKRITDAGMEFIMVAGNHDVDSALGCTTSVSYLKALGVPRVHLADKDVEIFEFDLIGFPIRFVCLPYFYKSQLQASTHEEVRDHIIAYVEDFWSNLDKKDDYLNICVPHYMVEGVFDGLDINEPILPISLFERFDFTAMGHVHKYMDFSDSGVMGGYCGSPYRVTFGEKEQKYFNVVDFERGEIDKIEIPNRDFVDIVLDARNADQRGIELFCVNKLKHMDLENKFFKMTIQAYDKFNLRPLYEHLRERKIFHYVPIQFERERVKAESRLDYEPSMGSIEVVKNYLKKQDLPKEFKAAVLKEATSSIKAVGI
jgi:DNA repair exonuclease SbcCD nuclease subunit